MKPARVHPVEWLAGLFGLALLAGLLLPWRDDSAALASPSLLGVLLTLVAVAAVLLPLVVACSARTDVPIVYETTLWTASLALVVVLVAKAIFPPEGGFDSGFWLTLAGIVLVSFSLWRSVARQP